MLLARCMSGITLNTKTLTPYLALMRCLRMTVVVWQTVMERFFRSLKAERLNHQSFANHYEVVQNVESYIYFYNYKRIHSAIGYMTPAQKMAELEKVAWNMSKINGPLQFVRPLQINGPLHSWFDWWCDVWIWWNKIMYKKHQQRQAGNRRVFHKVYF